jgi:hypothetical protein
MVHEYKETLPERDFVQNKIAIFTNEDQETFRKELFADDNPLWNLYDGYVPGATEPPPDTV